MSTSGLARNSFGWTAKACPKELEKWEKTVPHTAEKEDYFSHWHNNKQNTLNAFTLRCLLALHDKPQNSNLSIIKIADGQYAAERKRSNGDVCLAVGDDTGKIRAAIVKPDGTWQQMLHVEDPETDITVLYAVYLMLLVGSKNILQIPEPAMSILCSTKYKELMEASRMEDAEANVYLLNSALYYGLAKGKFRDDINPDNSVNELSKRAVKTLAGGIVLCGNPEYFTAKCSIAKLQLTNRTLGDIRKEFEEWAKTRKWTKSEEKFIPDFPDDFPVMPEVIRICRRFVSSRKFRRPMNNIMWRGPTAYGKSTGVELVACVLHTPLLRVTCSSTMEAQAFLTEFVPDSGNSRTVPFKGSSFPSYSEIELDPESAYEKITGVFKEGVAPQEVLDAIIKASSETSQFSGAVRYKLVESNLVKALRRGYICEVQEISRIRDPGVLVTLNEYDRAGAVIPLADGGFTRRDPLAMVIYTDNVGYRSCHQVDPSVMRRMDFVLDSIGLTDDQIVARVKYNTGFDDMERLGQMMKVWKSVIAFCKMNDITEGEISVNELERWVSVFMMEGEDAYEDACFECVVAKATPDRDDQELIKQAVINELRVPV